MEAICVSYIYDHWQGFLLAHTRSPLGGELRDITAALKGDRVMFSLHELRFNIPGNLTHWPL